MQANGAEMMRIACCLATERGIDVCAPVHDALLIEGPAGEIYDVVAATRTAMADASRMVLGVEIPTDAEIVQISRPLHRSARRCHVGSRQRVAISPGH